MIKKVAHVSFTVSNLENAIRFFVDDLGFRASPIMEVENEVVQSIIGMPDAVLLISNISLPDESTIELIEYVKPKGTSLDLKTCNIGVAHIAFEVENIEETYHRLSAKGVKFVNPPIWDEELRMTICYLRGPDGITFEMMEKA